MTGRAIDSHVPSRPLDWRPVLMPYMGALVEFRWIVLRDGTYKRVPWWEAR